MPLFLSVALGFALGSLLVDLIHAALVTVLSRRVNKQAKDNLAKLYEASKEKAGAGL